MASHTRFARNKKYIPIAVVEDGTKAGELKVYKVGQGGVKDITPSRIVEKDAESGAIKLYQTDIAGNKQFIPAKVIEAAPAANDSDDDAAVINAVTTEPAENHQ